MNPLQQIRYWYRWIFEPHFLAGEKAEENFETLSAVKGYILEKISQDRTSFDKYRNVARRRIKRGDYLVRNLKNLEVEVKCFTKRIYPATGDRSAVECYVIPYSHIKRHEEMMRLTGEPVVFAVFERNGREPVENSLRMIPLRDLTGKRKYGVFYDGRIKCLCIPIEIMHADFSYFDQYKSQLTQ